MWMDEWQGIQLCRSPGTARSDSDSEQAGTRRVVEEPSRGQGWGPLSGGTRCR